MQVICITTYMSEGDYDTLEIDQDDLGKYPGEKSRLTCVRNCAERLRSPIMVRIFIAAIVGLIIICFFGAGIGIGISIGKNAYTVSSEDCQDLHFYSLNDFDSKPLPDLPNPFDPLEIEAIPNSSFEFPEGIYHPLLPEKESPEYVTRFVDDYDIDRNDVTQRPLQETNEYQINLDTNRFIDREQGVREHQEIIAQFLAPYISQLDEPVITMWYELQYEHHGCGGDYSELRIRNYFSGKHENTASSSINKDVSPKMDLVTTLMFPSSQHLENFEMKLEQGNEEQNRLFNLKSCH